MRLGLITLLQILILEVFSVEKPKDDIALSNIENKFRSEENILNPLADKFGVAEHETFTLIAQNSATHDFLSQNSSTIIGSFLLIIGVIIISVLFPPFNNTGGDNSFNTVDIAVSAASHSLKQDLSRSFRTSERRIIDVSRLDIAPSIKNCPVENIIISKDVQDLVENIIPPITSNDVFQVVVGLTNGPL